MKLNKLFILGFFIYNRQCVAQQKFEVYHPDADARQQVDEAVVRAAALLLAEHKNVFLFIGGNWCGWCRKFYKFSKKDFQIDSHLRRLIILWSISISARKTAICH
ncbi:MAG: hypothetical protein R2847_12395 [Bacteroidia bacterium]